MTKSIEKNTNMHIIFSHFYRITSDVKEIVYSKISSTIILKDIFIALKYFSLPLPLVLLVILMHSTVHFTLTWSNYLNAHIKIMKTTSSVTFMIIDFNNRYILVFIQSILIISPAVHCKHRHILTEIWQHCSVARCEAWQISVCPPWIKNRLVISLFSLENERITL